MPVFSRRDREFYGSPSPTLPHLSTMFSFSFRVATHPTATRKFRRRAVEKLEWGIRLSSATSSMSVATTHAAGNEHDWMARKTVYMSDDCVHYTFPTPRQCRYRSYPSGVDKSITHPMRTRDFADELNHEEITAATKSIFQRYSIASLPLTD